MVAQSNTGSGGMLEIIPVCGKVNAYLYFPLDNQRIRSILKSTHQCCGGGSGAMRSTSEERENNLYPRIRASTDSICTWQCNDFDGDDQEAGSLDDVGYVNVALINSGLGCVLYLSLGRNAENVVLRRQDYGEQKHGNGRDADFRGTWITSEVLSNCSVFPAKCRDYGETILRAWRGRFAFEVPFNLRSLRFACASAAYFVRAGVDWLLLTSSFRFDIKPLHINIYYEGGEEKLLRSLTNARVHCKYCKNDVAEISSPKILFLPSDIWFQTNEVFTCEECPSVRHNGVVKMMRRQLFVGKEVLWLHIDDATGLLQDADSPKIEARCLKCGIVLGYRADEWNVHDRNYLHGRHRNESVNSLRRFDFWDTKRQTVATDQSRGLNCECLVLLKRRVQVQSKSRELFCDDIFWRYNDVCALAGDIELQCRAASLHKFVVVSDPSLDLLETPWEFVEEAEDEVVSQLELRIVLRECIFSSNRRDNMDGGKCLLRVPTEISFRAMKVMYTRRSIARRVASTVPVLRTGVNVFNRLETCLNERTAFDTELTDGPAGLRGEEWRFSYLPLP